MALSFSDFVKQFDIVINEKLLEIIEEMIDTNLTVPNYVANHTHRSPSGANMIVFTKNGATDLATAKAIIDKYTQAGWMKVDVVNLRRMSDASFAASTLDYTEIRLYIPGTQYGT